MYTFLHYIYILYIYITLTLAAMMSQTLEMYTIKHSLKGISIYTAIVWGDPLFAQQFDLESIILNFHNLIYFKLSSTLQAIDIYAHILATFVHIRDIFLQFSHNFLLLLKLDSPTDSSVKYQCLSWLLKSMY